MDEHRVSMLGASLRRYEDPARSADPRIRQLVTQLASLDPTPPPRAHFRAELRAQLVAVAPRLVAEGTTETTRPVRPARSAAGPAHAAATPERSRSRLSSVFARTGQVSIARPLGVLTAVIALFAVLLGGAVWVSKKALPGESLYALKRANESAQLSFASGDTAKGREYLKFARTRAEEVAALLKRASASATDGGAGAAAGINSHTAHLIDTTLDAADNELRSGTQLLAAQAVRSGSPDPLAIMTAWAPDQVERLQDISARLPAGSLHNRATKSTTLTDEAYDRARALPPVVGCKCLTTTTTDQFGPKPCTARCATPKRPAPGTGPSTAPPPTGAGSAPNPTSPATKVTNNSPGSGTAPGGSGGGSGSGSSGGGGLPLPSLPTLLPGPSTADDGSNPAAPPPTCVLDILGICIPKP
jgi:uncharacterized membrane protein YgcG